ncbi:helix-turn-helix transcriptional regulator [Pontibacter mucosus]
MLSESEANALVTAEQLVQQNSDDSFVKAYSGAIAKVKAVLKHSLQDKANLLSERIRIFQKAENKRTSSNLAALQFALTNFCLTTIKYTNEANLASDRTVEPFALVSTQGNWLLLAWCRLRHEFRFFRLDRMQKVEVLTESFTPHEMTLQEYFDRHY